MVDAGIIISEETLAAFNNVKMSKKAKWIIFKIQDQKEMVVDKTGGLESNWKEFVDAIPKSEQRFGIFDYEFKTNEKPPRAISKLIFIAWSPDDSDAKLRMIYASTKEKFRSKLVGTNHVVQANDYSDTFTKFVEIGRVALINFGKDKGKLALILDIVGEKRVLIEGPETGVERQVIPVRRLTLTKFKVPILKNQRTGVLKKAISKFKLQEKWSQTHAAKKLADKNRRRNLTDFERFKVMVLKKRLSNKVTGLLSKLKPSSKPVAPVKKEAAPKKTGKK